ncbi:MAG: MalY/PatB family protein [Dehalococcoidia bacterium]
MGYDFDTVYDRRGTDSSKWGRVEPDVLPMPVADMDFKSPEPIRRALRERVEHGFYGYGLAREELHQAFTARLKRRYGWEVPQEAVLPIPGVIPGFNIALRALTKPGESVAIQLPAYPPILNAHTHHGLVRRDAMLVRGDSGRYEIDFDSFRAAIDETTRAFILCNPHNPVGRAFSPEELRAMAEICLDRGLWIIADEIHCDLTLGDAVHTPIASLSPEIAERTITLMAPSKTFNLAGMKASVAVVTNPELRAAFEGGKGGLVGSVNIMGYAAMTAAYRDCDDWLAELQAYLTANRDFVTEFVRERMPTLRMAPPEATYLAWIDCNAIGAPGGDAAGWILGNARVSLNDGRTFGEPGNGFVRLNFGTPRSQLREGLERIAKAVAAHGAGGGV